MNTNLTLIGGVLTAIALALFVFGAAVLMDSLVYLYFK